MIGVGQLTRKIISEDRQAIALVENEDNIDPLQ